MTREKIEFKLPMVFSVAPILPEEDLEATIRFARYFSDSTDAATLKSTILGIVEGEARQLTAEMSVEDLFHKRDVFKSLINEKVGNEIKELGLKIINANIKELSDTSEDNKYFTYRKQRAIEIANYEAKVDVAEAKKFGEIGIHERQRDTRIALSQLDADAKRQENTRCEEVELSTATLEESKANAKQRISLANIEATMEVKNFESDLQQVVEISRQKQRIEQLRADDLGKTKVEAEKTITKAEGDSAAIRINSDANLYFEKAKAGGNYLNLTAHGKGLKSIVSSSNDPSLTKFYLALNNGLFEKLAEQQGLYFFFFLIFNICLIFV